MTDTTERVPHYRLRLYVYGQGPLTQAPVYDDLTAACAVADRVFAGLAAMPHKLPFRIDVFDVWTRETVTRLTPNVGRDVNVCAACGAPSDPFAAPIDPAGGYSPQPTLHPPAGS